MSEIHNENLNFIDLFAGAGGLSEPLYFETVIMDVDIREDKKQIKLLELAIQHGEEKKVDYDLRFKGQFRGTDFEEEQACETGNIIR